MLIGSIGDDHWALFVVWPVWLVLHNCATVLACFIIFVSALWSPEVNLAGNAFPSSRMKY